MRVVLDANVFISGLLSSNGPPGKILDAWLNQKFQLFVSPSIVAEVTRVFEYPRILARIDQCMAEQLLENMIKHCEFSADDCILDILHLDPSDNIYLAYAVESQADYLLTGNLKHYAEAGNPFCDIHVLSPAEFLKLL